MQPDGLQRQTANWYASLTRLSVIMRFEAMTLKIIKVPFLTMFGLAVTLTFDHKI